MNPIKIVFIDDEAPARRRLRILLEKDNRFQIIGEAENGVEGISLIEKLNPDALFLDIQLKDMTGFDLLKKVNPKYIKAIVFITAYDEYAIRAFEENAVDYLLKPFKNERFNKALDRLVEILENKNREPFEKLLKYLNERETTENFIRIKEGKLIHFFDPNEILYVKSENYYCFFYLKDDHKIIRISLKKVEEVMPKNFVRINRSVIINLDKVSSTKQLKKSLDIKMKNNQEFTAYHNFQDLI